MDTRYNTLPLPEKLKSLLEQHTSAKEIEIDHEVILFKISEWRKQTIHTVFELHGGMTFDDIIDTWQIRAEDRGSIYVLLYLKPLPNQCDHHKRRYSPYLGMNVCQVCGNQEKRMPSFQ